ncbi:hypothetical protein Tco_0482464 [Tanacetum coccineum]
MERCEPLGDLSSAKREYDNEMPRISAPTDREWIKSCLSELGEMSNGFKKALAAGLEQLVGTVTHRIRPVLDSVATVTYELLEEAYAENQRLVHAVETNSRWLQPLMTSNNYDSFVHLVIDFIFKRLEVIMMQKKIHWRSATGPRCEGFEKVSEILEFWGENAGPMTALKFD